MEVETEISMKILGIDSSSMVASVAIVDDNITIAEYTINYKKTHSQTLLPMLDEIVRMTETDMRDIGAIAVSGGPGSFTGLRIGSATAKGLGLALDIPLIHVPTLEAMAYNMWGTDRYVCPIMDARRSQVYTGIYYFENDNICNYMEQDAISIEELVDKCNALDKGVIFVGDGIPVFKDYIRENMSNTFAFAPVSMNRQRGASVAALGSVYYANGKTEKASEHLPEYLRVSQAERERSEREKGNKQ